MNKEAVQHERGPRNSTIRKQMADLSSASQIGFSPSQFSPLMRSPIPNLYPFTTFPTTPSRTQPEETRETRVFQETEMVSSQASDDQSVSRSPVFDVI